MILEIEDTKGNTLGSARIEPYDDEYGEPKVLKTSENLDWADTDFDDIYDTNEFKVRLQFNDDTGINEYISLNYDTVSVPIEFEDCKPLLKELNSYCAILKWYHRKKYHDCHILIQNYFGHIDYAKEFSYCKSHGEIVFILYSNLLWDLSPSENKLHPEKKNFEDFCNRMIQHIIYNLEQVHGYKVDKKEIKQKCY